MTDRRTILTVVAFLGVIGALLVLGDLLLVRELIHQGSGKGTVDPAAVGAVGGVSTLAGTVIGALGTLLVSTRSTPTAEQPDVANVDA